MFLFLCLESNILLVCLLVADKVEIGQLIFIGPGLYLFSPFTTPALTIPTSNTSLGHVPRLIRTLLCLRYNIIEKIEKFKELEKEGQQRIAKPTRTKYATGFTPGKSELFPLPNAAISANFNLTQNPGY